jgi:hypothetical protein
MKSITVEGIDPNLSQKLEETAQARDITVNQLLLDLIHAHFDETPEEGPPFHDLDHLFGRWTEEEFQRIQGKIDEEKIMDVVHPENYKDSG